MEPNGRVAIGYACPECESQDEHDIQYLDNTTQAMTLHCRACENVWHVEGLPETGPV